MVIQIGDLTINAQRLVGVENRRVKERVPIHHHHMMEKTAVDWDPTVLPGNATVRSVQVKWTNSNRLLQACRRSCARANDAKIVRSRDAQCNTKELP